jgi:hypothetical protein
VGGSVCNPKLLREFAKETAYYANTKIYLTLIIPVVPYASETWTLNEHDKNRFCIFERQILRKIFGPL